jgi:hypothetical protein
MYGVQYDILSRDGASHMTARATLSNGWTVKENCGGTVCIYFWPPSLSVYSDSPIIPLKQIQSLSRSCHLLKFSLKKIIINTGKFYIIEWK